MPHLPTPPPAPDLTKPYYRSGRDRVERTDGERWKPYRYDDLVARDKANLDITWLKDPSLTDADDGVPPEIIAREIVEDLQAALLEFEAVAVALEARAAERAASEPEDTRDWLADMAGRDRNGGRGGTMSGGGGRP